MRFYEKVARTLVAIPVFLLVLLCVSCVETKAPSPMIKVAGGSVDGVYSDLARTLARVVNDNQATLGMQAESVRSEGSDANIDSVIAGDVQFGIAQADDQFNAVNGLGEWANKGPQADLRSVVSIYSEIVTLVAGGDSGITSIEDLQGKRVDIGLVGSGSRQNAIDALEAAGLDWQKDIELIEMNADDRLAAFMKGELDAFFFTVGHPNTEVKFATFSVRGARLISLSGIDSLVVDKTYYSGQTIALGSYPRALNESSTQTVGVRATLVTSANVSDEIVYSFVKNAFESSEKFQVYFPEFADLRSGDILEGLTAPLHPGAAKYFREVGIIEPSE